MVEEHHHYHDEGGLSFVIIIVLVMAALFLGWYLFIGRVPAEPQKEEGIEGAINFEAPLPGSDN